MIPPGHHPPEDTLLAYGVGTLSPGAALTVAVHAERCSRCAADLRFLEGVGGALLTRLDPAPLVPGTAEDAMTRLGEAAARSGRSDRQDAGLPPSLRGRTPGRWRWLGPGLRAASLRGAGGPGEQIYLLQGKAGARIPRHGHMGTERFTVLSGQLLVENEAFGPTDYGEAVPGDVHAMTISRTGPCLCLFCTDGDLLFEGVARWWIALRTAANNLTAARRRGDPKDGSFRN